MDNTLRLIFKNALGRNVTISVKDPEDQLDAEDVEAAMDLIIERDIFQTSGGSITTKVRAEVVGRQVDVIAEF
ncbi:MAG: DUF2922 domain-containing protein [Dethiobacteria bacterium]